MEEYLGKFRFQFRDAQSMYDWQRSIGLESIEYVKSFAPDKLEIRGKDTAEGLFCDRFHSPRKTVVLQWLNPDGSVALQKKLAWGKMVKLPIDLSYAETGASTSTVILHSVKITDLLEDVLSSVMKTVTPLPENPTKFSAEAYNALPWVGDRT